MIGKIQITIKSAVHKKDELFSIEVERKIYQYNKIKNCPIRRSNTHIIIKNS